MIRVIAIGPVAALSSHLSRPTRRRVMESNQALRRHRASIGIGIARTKARTGRELAPVDRRNHHQHHSLTERTHSPPLIGLASFSSIVLRSDCGSRNKCCESVARRPCKGCHMPLNHLKLKAKIKTLTRQSNPFPLLDFVPDALGFAGFGSVWIAFGFAKNAHTQSGI